MIEKTMRGVSVGVQPLPGRDQFGHTHRLLIVDGALLPPDENGNQQLVPGSGTGEVTWVLLDEQAVKALHEQTVTSPIQIARVAPPEPISNGRRSR